MKIVNYEHWEVEDSGEKKVVFNRNQLGDTVVSELYVNPESDCTVVVTGYVDEDDTVGQVLKCVDIANLEKMDEVTVAGNYLYMVGSYCDVKIEVTGTSNVNIKELY